MSFTNAPVTRTLVLGLAASSIAASLFDVKHYFYILVDPHILKYHQTWRVLTYQLCYTNSSEVLFACMTLYHMRVIERMWGSRKYASYILVSAFLTVIFPPVLTFILRPLTFGVFNYLPAGPTAIIFSILAQYHAIIPHVYKYRLALSSTPQANNQISSLTFSDKSYRYVLAIQLALLQWPGSLLAAGVGWIVGYFWRNGVLPGRLTRWRIPGWMVGIRTHKRSEEFEGLRRRLEGENSPSGLSTAVQEPGEGGQGRRRTILDQFRGAL